MKTDRCCKEQYCIETWNVMSMNQGKLEVVKQEMARVNVNILGISELKLTGMSEFNSDDHYIYYCGQESLRRNGVAIMVNRSVWNAVLGCNLKNDRPFRWNLNQITYNYTVNVSNRFKGLDLIDRGPDDLWTEVCDIVQDTGIKTISMEKKCKKAKWLSEENLQISVKRREVKSKGEKGRYKHLNAEIQRIAKRDKKTFLSDQYKEI